MIKYLAIIAAWAGEKDIACEQLAIASRRPGGVTYGNLKLMPFGIPCAAIRVLKKSSPLSRPNDVWPTHVSLEKNLKFLRVLAKAIRSVRCKEILRPKQLSL